MLANALTNRLGIRLPILQSPMAGVSSPAMAAAVSRHGGLGALGVGAMNATQARDTLRQARGLGAERLNVNLFVHRPAHADAAKEAAWLARMRPEFERLGAQPPAALREAYTSFLVDDDMLAMLLEERPEVVSVHFGLPRPDQLAALREAGIALLASATNVDEGRAVEAAGFDAVVAQGYDAGGHRGVFDPDAPDEHLDAMPLTRALLGAVTIPVIAAGGLMDGADIARALRAGASAAQLGTAFVGTDESLADAGYRQLLFSDAAKRTQMIRVISGRPARGLPNAFTRWGEGAAVEAIPDYPIAYDAAKSLMAAARAGGVTGYGAHWAGTGAPRARAMSSGALMRALEGELRQALA